MQVQAINNINFGKIYLANGVYTDNQQAVIEQIKDTLRKPSEKFNNQSAEEFYKSNYKMDFLMENSPTGLDIQLSGKYGAKKIGTGVSETYKFSDSFVIGVYDKAHPFRTNDIEYSRKNSHKSNLMALGLFVLTGALYIFGLALAAKHDNTKNLQNVTKPLIESVDTTLNKVENVIPKDTILFKP